MAMETTTIACPAIRVSMVQDSKHSKYDSNVYSHQKEAKKDTLKEDMHEQFNHVLMQYHNEQLSLPQQINREMHETQVKQDAHQYFELPYKDTYTQEDGSRNQSLRLSHPEPIMSASNFSDIKQPNSSTSNNQTAMTKDIFPAGKNRTKYASTEKLPPIFSQITPRKSKKYNDSKLWLGPPNSIPPNKRNEHIAAYKTFALRIKSGDRPSANSTRSWTELNKIQREKHIHSLSNEITPLGMAPGILKQTSYHRESEDDASVSSICSVYSENSDTFSETNESTFRTLKSIDMAIHGTSGRASNTSSIHVRSMPDLESTSRREYTDSNFGNYSTKVVIPSTEHSYLDEVSVNSSTSIRHKKSVHFAPDVREISRENRIHPLSSGAKQHNSPLGVRLPFNYGGSMESVDQMPAVVEKFTLKSLPILPNINPSAMNVNANIIYIKGDGQMKSANTSAHSQTRRHSLQLPTSGSHKKLSREGNSVDDPKQYNQHVRDIKVALPSTQENNIKTTTTTTTSTSNSNSSPTSSQPSSNKVLHSKKTAANLPKKTYSTTKKVIVQKSKGTGNNAFTNNGGKKTKKPRNGSETSSRTSTNSSSPVLDMDDPEMRIREYNQAMLAVQARMREFDTKFGSPQKIEIHDETNEQHFGKVVVPSAASKQNKGKG